MATAPKADHARAIRRAIAPVLVGAVLAGLPTPPGLSPVAWYYTSGYIRKRDFWLYGALLGTVFLLTYVVIGVPWLIWRRQ